MSDLLKVQMLDQLLSEKGQLLSSLKMPIAFQARQLKKLHMEKKVKTIFSVRRPLKIKNLPQARRPEGPTQWRRKRGK